MKKENEKKRKMEYSINREKLLKLITDGEIDMKIIKEVTIEKLNVEKIMENGGVIAGSYAGYLAGINKEYNDIDIFKYKQYYGGEKREGKKIEIIIKYDWEKALMQEMKKEIEIEGEKYEGKLITFASFIIHLFDLDCCRYCVIPTIDRKYYLMTCSTGKRFLDEKVNYVDEYNARSLKVQARVYKYAQRGIKTLIQKPDTINYTSIYGYAKQNHTYGIVHDKRHIEWFLYHQHGININELFFKHKNKDIINSLNDISNFLDLHHPNNQVKLKIINAINNPYGKISSRSLSSLPKSWSKFKIADLHYLIPISHQKYIYWIDILFSNSSLNITSVSCSSSESSSSFSLRSNKIRNYIFKHGKSSSFNLKYLQTLAKNTVSTSFLSSYIDFYLPYSKSPKVKKSSHYKPSHSIPSHSIPSHSIPSHSIPSHSIPSHSSVSLSSTSSLQPTVLSSTSSLQPTVLLSETTLPSYILPTNIKKDPYDKIERNKNTSNVSDLFDEDALSILKTKW
mgnify:CR=1 FL=1